MSPTWWRLLMVIYIARGKDKQDDCSVTTERDRSSWQAFHCKHEWWWVRGDDRWSFTLFCWLTCTWVLETEFIRKLNSVGCLLEHQTHKDLPGCASADCCLSVSCFTSLWDTKRRETDAKCHCYCVINSVTVVEYTQCQWRMLFVFVCYQLSTVVTFKTDHDLCLHLPTTFMLLGLIHYTNVSYNMRTRMFWVLPCCHVFSWSVTFGSNINQPQHHLL